jgi:para-nitrobenzyl esterase
MMQNDRTALNRRRLFEYASCLIGGAAFQYGFPGTAAASVMESPTVQTAAGQVKGLSALGVHSFKGIPYAASTAGANRFMAPQPLAAWTGVRDATHYTTRSPQRASVYTGSPAAQLLYPFSYQTDLDSEDCLNLNLWTRGLGDGGKRPVMVWFHGGGFDYSSGNEWMFDGTNLALRGDVVVVTVNHRLNVFGYLNLKELGGPRYAHSANAGMLDLVASLQWIKDNIAAFGGDPGNVTIFGVSGGGAKVSTMLAMPAAKGLFHKAIIQSGPGLRAKSPESATKVAEAILKECGLSSAQVDRLQSVPVERLVAGIEPAMRSVANGESLLPGFPNMLPGFVPVLDEVDLPRHPFDPAGPDCSDDVPIIIGTTKDEAAFFTSDDPRIWNRTLTEAELKGRITQMVGPKDADRVIAVYRKAFPKKNPAELFIAAATGKANWSNSITLAERKYAKGKAPVYMYMFAWELPTFDGKFMACHAADVAFTFDNLDIVPNLTDRSAEPRALAAKVSGAYIEFARTGRPGDKALPAWPVYSPQERATMVFDTACGIVNDIDASLRHLWNDA